MRAIDFLSDSPKNYIFQKEVYKTNFGGVLFLIYCIIMLFITLTYILDYCFNEKYEIEYLKIRNQTMQEDIPLLDADPNLNPKLAFTITVKAKSDKVDNLAILYKENDGYYYFSNKSDFFKETGGYYREFTRNLSVSNLDILLLYSCGNDPNCTINETDAGDSEFHVQFQIPGPIIDHESPNPLRYDLNVHETFQYSSDFNSYKSPIYDWKVIKYKEKKGI